MREVKLPAVDAPPASRSLAALVAAVLEIPVEDVPCPVVEPWPAIAGFLATRNLAPVPVAAADRFQWGGWWIARLRGADGGVAEPYVLMAGTPSGIVWAPAGTGAPDGAEVAEGWVLAPPALELPADPARTDGVVEALFRIEGPGAVAEQLQQATLVAGVGLEGDRYATGSGRFSAAGRSGQALTLIEAEALEALEAGHGIRLEPGAHRRNVVTRGIDLNALRGRRFLVGSVECYAQRLAEPCSWLQRTTPAGTLRGLVHQGGLRADVVSGGVVHTGDAVTPLEG